MIIYIFINIKALNKSKSPFQLEVMQVSNVHGHRKIVLFHFHNFYSKLVRFLIQPHLPSTTAIATMPVSKSMPCLGIKSPVHRTGKKLDWDRTGPEKTRLSVAVQPFHEKENRKKPMKPNRFEQVWLGSNRTCVVLVNTLHLQLFWRKTVYNCMCYSQNDMLLSNPTCMTTCSYCFLWCRRLLSL